MKKNSSIARKILYNLLIVGAIYIAASSPYFALNLSKAIFCEFKKRKYFKAKNSQYDNAFYYLKRKGYLNIERKRGQIYIFLTEDLNFFCCHSNLEMSYLEQFRNVIPN